MSRRAPDGPMAGGVEALANRLVAGDVRAIARGITLAESAHARAADLLRATYPRTGRATTIGITGFPGAGKSSLVDKLISSYRARERTVGVVAVDPSSAFSGGAILGDRVRMMQHSADEGVYIRSMATRGHLGGLSRATGDVIDLLDASGRDVVLIETVGVGQDEIEIASMADVVLVVLVPGMGDDIQAIKAGILEIATTFVINKADRQGADRLESELKHMLSLAEDRSAQPDILRTVAIRAEGVEELVEHVDVLLGDEAMAERRAARRVRQAEGRLWNLLSRRLARRAVEGDFGREPWRELVGRLARREIDPYSAVDEVVNAGGAVGEAH